MSLATAARLVWALAFVVNTVFLFVHLSKDNTNEMVLSAFLALISLTFARDKTP